MVMGHSDSMNNISKQNQTSKIAESQSSYHVGSKNLKQLIGSGGGLSGRRDTFRSTKLSHQGSCHASPHKRHATGSKFSSYVMQPNSPFTGMKRAEPLR